MHNMNGKNPQILDKVVLPYARALYLSASKTD